MNLLVVIVNFRTPDLTRDCLASLAPELRAIGDSRAVVVDNHSADDSVPRLTQAIADAGWDDCCEVLALPRNHGYGGGLNRGWQLYRDEADFVLLLNSDTLIQPGSLQYLVQQMRADATIGALSCKLIEGDGTVQTTARKAPTPARSLACALGLPWRFPRLFGWADQQDLGWDRNTEARDVEWIGGAFMLVRGELLRQIGPMDEDFFFYGEDVELNYRIARAGYRRRYDPTVWITHLGAQSSDGAKLSRQLRSKFAWQARYLVQRKCYGHVAEWSLRLTDIVVWSARVLCYRLRHATDRYADARAVVGLLTGRLFA